MLFRFAVLTIALLNWGNCFASYSDVAPLPTFESAEHLLIGDKVILTFPADFPLTQKLVLANGLSLTYGEIVTLGGDFYGVPDVPIVSGETEAERETLFYQSYLTLAGSMNSVNEAPKILALIYDEKKQIEDSANTGEKPVDIYARLYLDHLISWNCITGGMCPEDYPHLKNLLRKIFYLKPGRYLKLALKDYDHFDQSAWLTYQAGHQLALKTAYAAVQTKNPQKLVEAYAMNAFASHFLSDGFASGHMRTQHLLLATKIRPSLIGSLFTNYMHNEDNQSGLIVGNLRGDTWKTFGDQYYLDERNSKNRALLQEAMQLSADEIFVTYNTGKMPLTDKVATLIPDLDSLTQNPASQLNPSPLFYWDSKNQIMMRRKVIADKYCYEWISNWSVWGTVLELIAAKGKIPTMDAMLLNNASTHDIAIFNHLVTDEV